MSFKALYRTYRPATFEEVVGQDHIILTLKNMIEKNRIGHAYLFAGPRGTGKTTVAKVFAKMINVFDHKLPLAESWKTSATFEQTEKINLDIIEIDAASNNGVNEVRTIIENSRYAPSSLKYKVYIIDEVHMLSKGAFNALLKTLEEPPKHVVFILATTEAHKIPVTILSRLQRFNFRRIDPKIIIEQLRYVLRQEKISFDEEALRLIASLAKGGLRDALSIADQTSSFGNGTVTEAHVAKVFGVAAIDKQIELINLAFGGNIKDMLKLLNSFVDNGTDLERLALTLIDVLKDWIVYDKVNDQSLLKTITINEALSLAINKNFAYQFADLLLKLISDLPHSELPRQAFELSLIKVADSANFEASPSPEKEEFVASTKEDLPSSVEVQKEDSPKDENILAETTEIDLSPDVIQGNSQADQELSELEETILATQEINVASDEESKKESSDLLSLFTVKDEESEKNTDEVKVADDGTILNLLLLGGHDHAALIKQRWSAIPTYSLDPKYGAFSTLLNSTSVITAGDNFILVSAKDNYVIAQLKDLHKDEDFLSFVANLFAKQHLVFAIRQDEFEDVKATWQKLNAAKELPEPQKLQFNFKETVKKDDNVKEFGTNLFGDLFDS